MVDLVKRLGDVKSTDAGCTTFVNNIIDTTNSTNSKTAANSLLKSELVVGRNKKCLKTIKNAVFKCLGQNKTDYNTPKVIAHQSFTITLSSAIPCHAAHATRGHLGLIEPVKYPIRSADPENPNNMKWIGSPVAKIWPFEIRHITRGAFETPFWGKGGHTRVMSVSYRLYL